MNRPEVWPPAQAGDEAVTEMLQRTALGLGTALSESAPDTPGLWVLRFIDTDHDVELSARLTEAVAPEGVHLPYTPVTWRADPVPSMAAEADPIEALVAWAPPDDAVGLVLSWAQMTPAGHARVTVAVLRDTTTAITLQVEGQPPATVEPDDVPTHAAQALRRCLGLPSGLPSPQPSLLLARMHAAVLDALAGLPDEHLPDTEGFSELLRADDPAAAERVERLVEMWESADLPALTVRRGALVATVAASPSVAASLVSNPIVGALIPMVNDAGGWDTVVTRLRVSPPSTPAVREEWWGWADDAMIAAVMSSILPPLRPSLHLERLVAAGVLPAAAAELTAEVVARIATATPEG